MAIVGITGGVDTHADIHVAAAVDHNGGLLDVQSFPADQTGYENLIGWLCGFGPVVRIGVEGTGSWGVGLTRFLTGQRRRSGRGGSAQPSDTTQAGQVRSDRCNLSS
jgi:transposase